MFGIDEIVAINNMAYQDAINIRVKSKNVTIPKDLLWKILRVGKRNHSELNSDCECHDCNWEDLEREARKLLLPYG